MSNDFFYLQKDNLFALPIIHYNMETASEVCKAIRTHKPACVAVEMAENLQLQLLHAASRLPDISIVTAYKKNRSPIYYFCEPCDAAFEALRSSLEVGIPSFCIDLDIDDYPEFREPLPDPYSIFRIGLKEYYHVYQQSALENKLPQTMQDRNRELHMAKKLKELCLKYDSVLFVGGMFHFDRILSMIDKTSFPHFDSFQRDYVEIATLTEDSMHEIMQEWGWISLHYENSRKAFIEGGEELFPPDRQKLIFNLLKQAAKAYKENTGNTFAGYHLRNTMKFARNYALITGRLLPDLFQLLSSAKGCVEHNFAYEVFKIATEYPFRKNIEGLPELPLTIEEVWGQSKKIHLHLKQPSRKSFNSFFHRKDKSKASFYPPGPFSICSFPPEDTIIENFGTFLKKKGTQILTEEGTRSLPFSSSIEDGIDTRETIRHWSEKKLYVKVHGKPPGAVGSVVVIFDEDKPEEGKPFKEKYPWATTWIGEHNQESDMAFYATPITERIIGPGISRCEYGGFMMSYPPRRLFDVWSDPDYAECRSKAEVLLVAAIDYALKPLIAYVASKPPRTLIKSFAKRFGKKIVYIPIGQLSPVTLNKLRIFHVLDGRDKRDIAGEYII